jgi:uncharacterized protein (TIGR00369 family)
MKKRKQRGGVEVERGGWGAGHGGRELGTPADGRATAMPAATRQVVSHREANADESLMTVQPGHFSLDELRAYLVEVFPEMWKSGHYAIESVAPMRATVRLRSHPDHLRPGGTISGPAMFALSDLALYVAILNEIGRVKLAVTTNVSINFLRRPDPVDLIGEAKLMKLGKRLAVGEVGLYSEGKPDLVAHAVGTYSIPDRGD